MHSKPAWQDFGSGGQFRHQFTYRVRIDELGADFGGEVPRAEGVGGGKPPPNTCSDTPDRGSADLG